MTPQAEGRNDAERVRFRDAARLAFLPDPALDKIPLRTQWVIFGTTLGCTALATAIGGPVGLLMMEPWLAVRGDGLLGQRQRESNLEVAPEVTAPEMQEI